MTRVLGECFGDADPSLRWQACQLADAAGVDYLAVTFTSRHAGAAFVGADPWPDLSNEQVVAALLQRFCRGVDSTLEVAV